MRSGKKVRTNPLNSVKSAEPAPKTDEENEELKREWLKPFIVFVMEEREGSDWEYDEDNDENVDVLTMIVSHNSSDDSDFCCLTHGDDSD